MRLRGSRPWGWKATAFCHRDSPQRSTQKGHDTRLLLYTALAPCAVHTRTPAQPHVVFQVPHSRTHGTCTHSEGRNVTQHLCSSLCQKACLSPASPSSSSSSTHTLTVCRRVPGLRLSLFWDVTNFVCYAPFLRRWRNRSATRGLTTPPCSASTRGARNSCNLPRFSKRLIEPSFRS